MRDRRDLIEMYSIWVKPEFLTTEAIASRCADEAIRFAKEYHSEQLILNGVIKPFCEHKAKLLTKKEVEENRSSAYKYLDI